MDGGLGGFLALGFQVQGSGFRAVAVKASGLHGLRCQGLEGRVSGIKNKAPGFKHWV